MKGVKIGTAMNSIIARTLVAADHLYEDDSAIFAFVLLI